MGVDKGKQPECVYIASGCNRYSNVADVREDGLVVYGAGKFVALWNSEDPTHKGVHRTLPGHIGHVTTIKFLRSKQDNIVPNCHSFVSGDSSGKIIIWTQDEDRGFVQVAQVVLEAAVASLATLHWADGRFIITAGTSHGNVHTYIYTFNGALIENGSPLTFKSKMPLDIALSKLPETQYVIMAVGMTDSRIHIFTTDETLLASPAAENPSTSFARPLNPSSSWSVSKPWLASTQLLGHTDWIRALSFSDGMHLTPEERSRYGYRSRDILLASGSQDNYTRLWRISQSEGHGMHIQGDLLDDLDSLPEGEIEAKTYAYTHENLLINIHAESVLLGHENWVTGVHWHNQQGKIPRLLTASADRSMMMWGLDPATKIWLNTNRFGEIGGTNLGFFGALWGAQGKTIYAHGWGGSFHVWKNVQEQDQDQESWKSRLSISGHYGHVTSLAWEPEGKYIVSVSTDQTARLHASWRRDNGTETWHEMARPQIHGYDMEDVAFLSRMRYISGSEEKIVRVFDAPGVFIESMHQLGVDENLIDDGNRPNAATVPALGLSNKAVFSSTGQSELNGTASGTSQALTFQAAVKPPLEEQLLTSTLWPETEKLYGHGYEINAIATSHDGQLIASACRSTTAEHAVIRLHRTSNWGQLSHTLAGHTLTITSIKFSPNDRYILSVSRDRSWQLYERLHDGEAFTRRAHLAKAHARIIWDCAWAADSSFFATASRDKQVKIWQIEDGHALTCKAAATLALPDAATAVAICQVGNQHYLAAGTEAGHIQIYMSKASQPDLWEQISSLDSYVAHCATVRTLAWQASRNDVQQPSTTLLLASGSDDNSLRVIRIPI